MIQQKKIDISLDGVRRESEQLRTQWKHSIVFCFVDFQSARENGPRGNFARVQFIVDTNRIYRDIQFFTVLKFIYFETPIGVEKHIYHISHRVQYIFLSFIPANVLLTIHVQATRGNSDLYIGSMELTIILNQMVLFDEKDPRVCVKTYTCREKNANGDRSRAKKAALYLFIYYLALLSHRHLVPLHLFLVLFSLPFSSVLLYLFS